MQRTIKLLENKTGENLESPSFGDEVLDATPKLTIHEKNNWQDNIVNTHCLNRFYTAHLFKIK